VPGSADSSGGSPGFHRLHRWSGWVRGPLPSCCKSLHFRVDRWLQPRLMPAVWTRSGCLIHRDPLQHGQPALAAADPLTATAAQGGSAPPAGGDCASSASGRPPTKCATFFRGPGCGWHPVGTRAAAVAVDPVVSGLVSRTASPHSAPEQPASPAGHPVSAALRRDSRGGRGDVCARGVESSREARHPGRALDRRLLWEH